MRVTQLDSCGNPIFGSASSVVTDGFVSVAATTNVKEAEAIEVVNAAGRTCVRDPGCSEFQGYGLEITFCDVNPCLIGLMTGQPSVLDASGEVAGFRMNTSVSPCDHAFALEVWMGVPGVACSGAAGSYGYLLLPNIQAGVIGDFTIENAAISFVVTGANTKDGTGWGVGPYNVVEDVGGAAAQLPDALDPDDHLYQVYTEIPPPEITDGCVALAPPT